MIGVALALVAALALIFALPTEQFHARAATPAPSSAASPGADATSPPLAVTAMTRHGYRIAAHGPYPGDPHLEVWMLQDKRGGPFTPVFSTPGGAVISGLTLGAKGQDTTAALIRHFMLQPPLAWLYHHLMHSHYAVHDGVASAKRQILVIGDANCYYTHDLWVKLRPWVASGKLRVTWLFVPIIHENSAGKAARIITSRDREKALTENETRYDASREEGGAAPIPASQIPAAVQNDLAANSTWLARLGTGGTPTMLYPGPGGKIEVMDGVPPSSRSLKAVVTGNAQPAGEGDASVPPAQAGGAHCSG